MIFRTLRTKVRVALARLRARLHNTVQTGRMRSDRKACTYLRCATILFILFVTLFLIQIAVPSIKNMELIGDKFSDFIPNPASATTPGPGVTIWTPRTSRACTGAWNSARAGGDGTEPYVMIREVVLDRRHASVEEFRTMYARERGRKSSIETTPPFLRIVFYLSVHLSVKLSSPGRLDKAGVPLGPTLRVLSDELGGENATASTFVKRDVEAHVDYVIHSTRFLVHDGSYKPGTKTTRTTYNDRISEWQVVVSLRAKDGTYILDSQHWEENIRLAARMGAKLSLTLPLLRHDDAVVVYEPTMRLECVTGWEEPEALPAVLTRVERPKNCSRATGSVAMLGKAVHGMKKKTKLRDIAHFAARALLGPLRYELVVVTIVPERSLFEMYEVCRDDNECIVRMEAENANLLKTVANVTEHELSMLGVPRTLFPNIIVIPFCRFGSDYNGKERGSPCAASLWSSQHQNNYFAYTLVSHYFKWASAMDLDEFFAPNVHDRGIIRSGSSFPASNAFDKYSFKTDGAVRFSWLNIHFRTLNESRGLTQDVMRSSHISLLYSPSQNASHPICYEQRKITNGKCALSCRYGLGFTIHSAVRLKPGGKLNDSTMTTRVTTTAVRTWHSRWGSSMGPCAYVLNFRPVSRIRVSSLFDQLLQTMWQVR